MELIERLRNESSIQSFIVSECEDEGICVEFTPKIDRNSVLIIKVDDFYNAQHLKIRPASVDCLIIQFCQENQYQVYLVELKNVQKQQFIHRKNLHEKFKNTLYDFIRNQLVDYFYDEKYECQFRLILNAGKQENQQIKILSLDFLLSLSPILFQGKRYGIHGFPPNFVVKPCMQSSNSNI